MPARIGLVIIGGEGALVLGGFAAAAVAIPLVAARRRCSLTLASWRSTSVLVGGFWIGIVGYLRYARGVNETISSLLMTYIGIAIMNFFVEGALRDFSNPNKPSTKPIGDAYMVGTIPGTEVHWGLVVGVVLCDRAVHSAVAHYVRLCRAGLGRQSARRLGARPSGRQADRYLLRDRGRLRRPRRLLRGRGDPGPRQRVARSRLRLYRNPGRRSWRGIIRSPIIPVAILFGGIVASGGLIERRMGLPDATVLVLQGLTFVDPADIGNPVRPLQDFPGHAQAADRT